MSNPLHAAYYADAAVCRTVEILENVKLARDTFRVRFACPELARAIVPGQFLMLRLSGANDPLIGRPFALYDTVLDAAGAPVGVDVVYLVKGKFTSRLCAARPGERLDVWGPLGNGFAPPPVEHLVMVAGGIGQTPFLALGRECRGARQYGWPARSVRPIPRVTLCYGARSADLFAGLADFEAAGIALQLTTDDGSRGRRGFVTELVRDTLSASPAAVRSVQLVCCGPEPMMRAVARLAAEFDVPCQVSLETPMACGIGVCFTCVAKVRDGEGTWDYKRTCVEGPVFDAAAIEWDA